MQTRILVQEEYHSKVHELENERSRLMREIAQLTENVMRLKGAERKDPRSLGSPPNKTKSW